MQKLGASYLLRSFTARNVLSHVHHRSNSMHTNFPAAPFFISPHRQLHGIHAFECPDQVGITAKIAACISRRGASILDVDVHVNRDNVHEPAFFARTQFVFDPSQWPRDVMDEDFMKLKKDFSAKRSIVRVPESEPPLKIAILVSRKDPCLVDSLHLWQEGKVPVHIMCVVSNHVREENTHVMRFLARHKIPYHFVPANKHNRHEKEILNLVSQMDFLVLAHYMQILSPEFLKVYGRDIINIHHGLLPSFKGANPYKQAYEAGVKLIGATSHFVIEELDGGPIIEQMVERVSHRDTLESFAMKSEYLEKACLVKAIRYYCELRIIRYGGKKTIVFD
ncbi:hypothetical protein GOP47_0022552 [Adiantum capillus-veneris]|uniref:ACT domain-containing protein n=1 Tax=Adiantum capillus-veneris TaxID=13818 RepID=A0A9D4U6Q1_ADICA|nr:hypothetical protein GOP47_0022552 [Adiantum capillus-veneris]